jgi:hypothetical protein
MLFSLFSREDWPYSRVLKKNMDKNGTEATLCTLSQKDHHAAVVRSTCENNCEQIIKFSYIFERTKKFKCALKKTDAVRNAGCVLVPAALHAEPSDANLRSTK